MSTRDERREWQAFREKHGATLAEFKRRYRAMFTREPDAEEQEQYRQMRKKLKLPLGRKQPSFITTRRTVSMGHRLPTYDGVCSSLHGHNITIESTIRVTKFVDFKEVDRHLAELTDKLDHTMVLHDADTMFPALKGWPIRIMGLSVEPTTEALAQLVLNHMLSRYKATSVTVHETAKYSATAEGKADPRVSVTHFEGR